MRSGMMALFVALLAGSAWAADSSEAYKAQLPPDEMPQHLVKVLRTTNKAQTNRYVPKVYRFENVNPFAVVRFIRRVAEIEEGRFATFVGPDGKSGRVMVIAPEYQIPYIDNLMRIIDRPGLTTSSGSDRQYVQLKYRAADDVGLLRTIWGQSTHSASRPSAGSRAGDTDVVCDLETGAVYIEGPESSTRRALEVIAELDRPMPQVLIDATLYEIDLNNDGAIGFDYHAWKNGPGRNAFAFGAFAEYGSVDRLKGGVNVFDPGLGNTYGLPHNRFRNHGYNAAWFLDVPSAYFDFLVTKGAARVVTSGRVMSKMPSNYKQGLNRFGQSEFDPQDDRPTLVASPAEFVAADEVLYYRVFTGPSARAGARPAGLMVDPYGDDIDSPDNRTLVGRLNPLAAEGTDIIGREIAAVDVGTFLRVTPRLGVENILLDLELEASSLTGFDGVGEPKISARRAVADVRVGNNEEVVFGGLERIRRIQSTRKFPLLGSLPVLGWAFGGENSGVKKSVVVAVVRATKLEAGLPADVATLVDQVDGPTATDLPKDEFGFDQWLLDQ